MKNLRSVSIIIFACFYVLSSCHQDEGVTPPTKKDQYVFSLDDATSVSGIMAYKDQQALFGYSNMLGSKSKSDRLAIEAKNNFVSLASLYEDFMGAVHKSFYLSTNLVKKIDGQYEYTPAALFFAAVANKDGYFITGNVLNQINNTYVKSTKLSDFSPATLQHAMEKLDNWEKIGANKVDKDVAIKTLITKKITTLIGPSARVPGNYNATVETDRTRNGIPSGYEYSAELTLHYESWVDSYRYCNGDLVYDEYGNQQCTGEWVNEPPRVFCRIYGTVRGIRSGNTSTSDNTINTSVSCNLSVYIPGHGVTSVNASQSSDNPMMYFYLYYYESNVYDNTSAYAEGTVQYSATHRTLNSPYAVPFTTSGQLTL